MICKVALAPTCSYWTRSGSFDYEGTWVRLSVMALEHFCFHGRERWVTSLLPLSLYKHLHMDIFSLLRWKGRQHFFVEQVISSWSIQGALRIWSSSRRNSSGNELFFSEALFLTMCPRTFELGSVFLGFISLQSSSTGAWNAALGSNTNGMDDLAAARLPGTERATQQQSAVAHTQKATTIRTLPSLRSNKKTRK